MLSQDHPWNNLKLEFKNDNILTNCHIKEPPILRNNNIGNYSKPKKNKNIQINNYYKLEDIDNNKCNCIIS